MRRFLIALAVLAAAGRGSAAPPVAADPNKEYAVTPEAGPWMICAASFTGPQAPQLAHGLVVELRQNYGLPAYVFNRGAEERRKEQERVEKIRQQQREFLKQLGASTEVVPARVKTIRIEEQFAVLLGGYKDIDTARKELDRIKKLKSPPTQFCNYVAIAGLDQAGELDKKGGEVQRSFVNPFQTSFVVPNPTVPHERPDPSKVDPLLKQLNAGESFSLLKCPQPYTLVVTSFQGASVIQPRSEPSSFLTKLGLGSKSGDMLQASALQAHSVAEVLRKLNFEAYVLHRRYDSLVTVGGFSGPDDPKLAATQRQLAGLKLDPIQLLPQAVPFQIPRP
jgi:hypothetical protein